MKTELTKAGKLRLINAILETNAAMLGQELHLKVKRGPAGSVRIGELERGGVYKQYSSLDVAVQAAWTALANGRARTGQ